MADTASWEEASRCPKCNEPGKDTRQMGSVRGKAHILVCMNERCAWFNTSWVVQVRRDGTIPVRRAGPKQFMNLTGGQEAMARRVLEDLKFETTRRDPTQH
jgi:hypothetical protein